MLGPRCSMPPSPLPRWPLGYEKPLPLPLVIYLQCPSYRSLSPSTLMCLHIETPKTTIKCYLSASILNSSSHTDSLAQGIMCIHLIVFKVWGINHWTMKYRSQWPTFILRSSTKSYWLIIPRYYVYTSNSLQNIHVRQNHWTMKYRSQRPTYILRSIIKSYWPISPRYHVYTPNNLQDIRQNHWTMKYRSQWPTLRWYLSASILNSWSTIDENSWTCKQCRSWWGGSWWATSSRFTLFVL